MKYVLLVITAGLMVLHTRCDHPLVAFKKGFLTSLSGRKFRKGSTQLSADGQITLGFDFSSRRGSKRGNLNLGGNLNVSKKRPGHSHSFNGNVDVNGSFRKEKKDNHETDITGNLDVKGSFRKEKKWTQKTEEDILKPEMMFDITNEGSGTGAIINIHQGDNFETSTSAIDIVGPDFAGTDTIVRTDIANDYGPDFGTDTAIETDIANDYGSDFNTDTTVGSEVANDYGSDLATDTAVGSDIGNDSFSDFNTDTAVGSEVANDYVSGLTTDTAVESNIANDYGSDFSSTSNDFNSGFSNSGNEASDFDLGTESFNDFDTTPAVDSSNDYYSDAGNDYGSMVNPDNADSIGEYDGTIDNTNSIPEVVSLSVDEPPTVRESSASRFAKFLTTNVDAMKDLSEYVRINWGPGPHRIRIRSRKRRPAHVYSTSSSLSLNRNPATKSRYVVVEAPLLYKYNEGIEYDSSVTPTDPLFDANTSNLVSNNIFLSYNSREAGKSIVNSKDKQKIASSNKLKRNKKTENRRRQPVSKIISPVSISKPNRRTVTQSERSQLSFLANFAESHRQSRIRSKKNSGSTGESRSIINPRLLAKNLKTDSVRSKSNSSRRLVRKNSPRKSAAIKARSISSSNSSNTLDTKERSALRRIIAAVLKRQARVQQGQLKTFRRQ